MITFVLYGMRLSYTLMCFVLPKRGCILLYTCMLLIAAWGYYIFILVAIHKFLQPNKQYTLKVIINIKILLYLKYGENLRNKINWSIDLAFSIKVWQGFWLQHWPVALTHWVQMVLHLHAVLKCLWPTYDLLYLLVLWLQQRCSSHTAVVQLILGVLCLNSLNWKVT